MIEKDIIIIGAGPAGLSAAIKAKELGTKDVLVIERNEHDGGILNQCIHSGFGLHVFKEELTGPEYAAKLSSRAKELSVEIKFNSMVLDVTSEKIVKVLSEDGILEYKAKAIILTMGCRERPRGAINIPGKRVSGIFTAGTAQELMNLKGYNVGNEAVILGSGDIGLIMARRLTLEGIKVKCVIELMPYSSGLKRNIAQCLDDYNIPLYYSSTITNIEGNDRVTGIRFAKVDENRNPIFETEEFISCDTVLFSVGLIPENDIVNDIGIKMSGLTGGALVDSHYETNLPGIFACGNALHVHDLVDNVTYESFSAANWACEYVLRGEEDKKLIPVKTENGVRYSIPNFVDLNQNTEFFELKFRTDNVYKNYKVIVTADDEEIYNKKKKILTPGEMEIVKINKSDLKNNPKSISIRTEE